MQHVDDMIARLVATYPDEADLVHDVVRGVLDDSRRDGVGSLRPADEADERLARLLRARVSTAPGPPTMHHPTRESHDVDPAARRPRAFGRQSGTAPVSDEQVERMVTVLNCHRAARGRRARQDHASSDVPAPVAGRPKAAPERR